MWQMEKKNMIKKWGILLSTGYKSTQTSSMLTSTAVSHQATDAVHVFPLAEAMQDA